MRSAILSLQAGSDPSCTIPEELVSYTFLAGGRRYRLVPESLDEAGGLERDDGLDMNFPTEKQPPHPNDPTDGD